MTGGLYDFPNRFVRKGTWAIDPCRGTMPFPLTEKDSSIMREQHHGRFARVLMSTFALAAWPAWADGTAAAQYRSGTLAIDVAPTEVGMQLRMPMTRAEASASKQELTPAEVVARLKAADKLFVFPPAGKCEVDSANAFAVDAQGKPTTADGNIQAMYRFRCEGAAKSKMEKIVVKLFEQLPGLDKIKVQLTTEKGESTADLTATAPDIPL
jgi:Protein of unknown function (DUF2796)